MIWNNILLLVACIFFIWGIISFINKIVSALNDSLIRLRGGRISTMIEVILCGISLYYIIYYCNRF